MWVLRRWEPQGCTARGRRDCLAGKRLAGRRLRLLKTPARLSVWAVRREGGKAATGCRITERSPMRCRAGDSDAGRPLAGEQDKGQKQAPCRGLADQGGKRENAISHPNGQPASQQSRRAAPFSSPQEGQGR